MLESPRRRWANAGGAAGRSQMHANERERLIGELLQSRGFVSFQELDRRPVLRRPERG